MHPGRHGQLTLHGVHAQPSQDVHALVQAVKQPLFTFASTGVTYTAVLHPQPWWMAFTMPECMKTSAKCRGPPNLRSQHSCPTIYLLTRHTTHVLRCAQSHTACASCQSHVQKIMDQARDHASLIHRVCALRDSRAAASGYQHPPSSARFLQMMDVKRAPADAWWL